MAWAEIWKVDSTGDYMDYVGTFWKKRKLCKELRKRIKKADYDLCPASFRKGKKGSIRCEEHYDKKEAEEALEFIKYSISHLEKCKKCEKNKVSIADVTHELRYFEKGYGK